MPSLTRSPAYYFGLAAFFAALLVLGLLGASPGFTATDRYLPHGFCYAWQRSEFVIRLPRVQPPPAVQYAGGPAQPRAMRLLRVLIVDDNRDTADSIAILLDLAGHDVEVAYEGLAALELARRNVPDVALLDIGLPTLDSYDLARALSTLDPRPRMIAITGWGTAEDQAKARAAGFDRHMTKPVDPQRVLEALAEFDPPPKTAS